MEQFGAGLILVLILFLCLFYGPIAAWIAAKALETAARAEYFRAKTESLKAGKPSDDPEEFA